LQPETKYGDEPVKKTTNKKHSTKNSAKKEIVVGSSSKGHKYDMITRNPKL